MGVRAKYLKKLFTSDLRDGETRKQARARLWDEASSEYSTELHNNTQNALNNYFNLQNKLNLISPYEELAAGGNDSKPSDIYQNYQKSGEQKDQITRDLELKATPTISDHTETNDRLKQQYNDRIAGYNLAFKQSFGGNPEVDAAEMQQQLKKAGLYKGEIDGLWGPKSQQAYAEFLKQSQNPSGDIQQGGPNWIDFIKKTTVAQGGPVARAMNQRYYHQDQHLVHLPLFESPNGAPSSTVRQVEALADPVASVTNPSLGMGTTQTTEQQPHKDTFTYSPEGVTGNWWEPQPYDTGVETGRRGYFYSLYTVSKGKD